MENATAHLCASKRRIFSMVAPLVSIFFVVSCSVAVSGTSITTTTLHTNTNTPPTNTTTLPTNTTTLPTITTTPPTNTTTPPTNTTTPPTNTTTPPTNATTPASNTTTPSTNTTTPASNTTTPSTNTTTPSTNTTTPTSNTTTPPTNTTTPPTNTTTPASNSTIAPTSTTPPPTNTTTQPSNTTTTSSAPPTPSSRVKWAVRDKNEKLCMLMDFNGTITYESASGGPVSSWIPANATPGNSHCNESWAKFMLDFVALNVKWQIGLNFTDRGSSYVLNDVSALLYDIHGILIADGYSNTDFFSVPIGSYYSCASFNETLSGFQLNISEPVFQPFVQRTTANDLGNEFVCGSKRSHGSTGKVVLGVFITLLIVGAAAGITYYVMKKRRPREPPYGRMN